MAWKGSTPSSIAGNIIEGGAIDTQVTGTGNLGEQEAGLTVGTSVVLTFCLGFLTNVSFFNENASLSRRLCQSC